MLCICFTRAGHSANGHPKNQACDSLTEHLCSGSGFIRSHQESENLIEGNLGRFTSETSHNARGATQVSFLKRKAKPQISRAPAEISSPDPLRRR